MRRRAILRHSPFVLALLFMGASTAAYTTLAFLNDVEPTDPLPFTAGTLDLTLDHPDEVDAFVTHPNFAPGDVAEGRLYLRNAGTISSDDGAGHTVLLLITTHATATDAHGGNTDMPAWLEVTAFRYGTVDLLGLVGDANGNGWVDLEDAVAADIHDLADPGERTDLLLRVRFHPDAGNGLQGDATEARFAFSLTQV